MRQATWRDVVRVLDELHARLAVDGHRARWRLDWARGRRLRVTVTRLSDRKQLSELIPLVLP